MQFRDSEDGEVLYTLYENRRSSTGKRLPPAPRDDRSYDQRQVAPRSSSAATDVQGQAITGP